MWKSFLVVFAVCGLSALGQAADTDNGAFQAAPTRFASLKIWLSQPPAGTLASNGGYIPASSNDCGCKRELDSPNGCTGMWSGYIARPCSHHQHYADGGAGGYGAGGNGCDSGCNGAYAGGCDGACGGGCGCRGGFGGSRGPLAIGAFGCCAACPAPAPSCCKTCGKHHHCQLLANLRHTVCSACKPAKCGQPACGCSEPACDCGQPACGCGTAAANNSSSSPSDIIDPGMAPLPTLENDEKPAPAAGRSSRRIHSVGFSG